MTWRKHLVTQGTIPGPTPFAVDRLVRIQEQRTGRRIKDAHIPQVAAAVEQEISRLEFLEDFRAHLEETEIKARQGSRVRG